MRMLRAWLRQLFITKRCCPSSDALGGYTIHFIYCIWGNLRYGLPVTDCSLLGSCGHHVAGNPVSRCAIAASQQRCR